MATRKEKTKDFIQYLFNQQMDDSVDPPAMVLGMKGKAADGAYYPILVDTDGKLLIGGITLETGDIEIGAVEIKDHDGTDRLEITATNAAKVDGSGVTQPVSGTVTANAGTNLNTSLLALESGGNLAAIKTAVETLDNIVAGSEAQVDVLTQPARDRTTDNVGVGLQTDVIMNDTTALIPKYKAVVATTGDNTLIAASAGFKMRVLALYGTADVAGTVRFESGTGGTALTGQVNVADTGGFVLPFNPVGWFETDDGDDELLNLELTTSGNFDGCLVYVEVPD